MIVRERKTLDAQQWFRNGDHSDDESIVCTNSEGLEFWSEGDVVRYFRHPNVPGKDRCSVCHKQMHIHGWIDNGGPIGASVCPGDWIIREGMDKYLAVPPGAFKEMYEEIQ